MQNEFYRALMDRLHDDVEREILAAFYSIEGTLADDLELERLTDEQTADIDAILRRLVGDVVKNVWDASLELIDERGRSQ